jgi:leader peptidase (prepilin peptidase)/N-methyltransferase
MSPQWHVTVAVLVGAVIGSFLNVCIHRLPLRESIMRPGSRCPQCTTPIAWYDNFPILSYLRLRGRCLSCRARIGWRYPFVEALNAAGYGFIAWRFGMTATAFVYCVLFSALVVITFIDLDHESIPDFITLPGIAFGLVVGALLLPQRWDSIIGLLLGYGVLGLLADYYYFFTERDGMGHGDVKLLGMIGAFLGWQQVIFVLLLGSLTGSVVGLTLMAARKLGWRQHIPFGPYLCVGAVVAMLFGPEILGWYGEILAGRR